MSEEKNQDKKNEGPSKGDLMHEIETANREIDSWFPNIPPGKLYIRIRMLKEDLEK